MNSEQPQHRCRGRHRAGFTLVELMVVVAIIGVIIALTTVAAMQAVSYQRSSTTNGTIQAVSSLLDQQWAAVILQAHNESNIPPGVLTMAGGNIKRARVIWEKLKLKQAFPMNFTEALAPWSLPPGTPAVLSPTDLPGLSAYKSAISQSGLKPSPNPADWPKESAYCLVMALQQGFGGHQFSEERFGSNVLGADPGVVGLRRFVDGWSNPLVFYRWPTANTELDNSSPLGAYNPNSPAGTKTWFRDPLDPEGLLLSPDWNFKGGPGVTLFEQYCHAVHAANLRSAWTPRAYYLVPVIASAGRDGLLGLKPPTASPLLPDPMAPANPLNPTETYDNVYSFRIRLGGRGGQ